MIGPTSPRAGSAASHPRAGSCRYPAGFCPLSALVRIVLLAGRYLAWMTGSTPRGRACGFPGYPQPWQLPSHPELRHRWSD